MSEIIIGGKPIPALYIGIGLPVLALLYVGYVGFMAEENLMAKNDALVAQEAGVIEKQAQADELRERTKQIDTIKAEITALERSIALLKQKIPGEAQVPVLLFDIERMAKGSQGTMSSFQPGALRAFGSEGDNAATDPNATKSSANTNDIMELPVTIQATATYPEIIKFLSQVSNYERKLNVGNLKLSPGKALGGEGGSESGKNSIVFKNTLSVEFTLSAYILKQGGAQQP
jgi:Tfp pilus assembly protein PilO